MDKLLESAGTHQEIKEYNDNILFANMYIDKVGFGFKGNMIHR